MPRKKPRVPKPLELLFVLIDSCIHRLSPNAWKVVCYVAAQDMRVYAEWLEFDREPMLFFVKRDIEGMTHGNLIFPPGAPAERSYRPVQDGPAVPGQPGPARFPVISLDNFCHGVRLKRGYRDYGTGLSKSSVAEAIKEALRSEILVRERHQSMTGRDLASLYAIDWDRVQEYDWRRRKGLK